MTHQVAHVTAAQLVKLVNDYAIATQPQREIRVPHASRLAALHEISLEGGVLLPKELARKTAGQSRPKLRPSKSGYATEKEDGDLHFQIGTPKGKLKDGHVGCELQRAKGWVDQFTARVGKSMNVVGFFRCLFEHPGFAGPADAHIFEVHPVRQVGPLHGEVLHAFDVKIPEPASVHEWKGSHLDANKQDKAMSVKYLKAKDTLVFSGMGQGDKNYVQVKGTISNLSAPSGDEPATFRFSSPEIAASPLDGFCLTATNARDQLVDLRAQGKTKVWLVGLRNIDIHAAIQGRYRISLLAIDIRDQAAGPAIPSHSLCKDCQ